MLRLLIASVVALSVCSAVSHNAVRQDVLDRRIQKKVSSKVGSDWGDVASGYEDVGNAIKDVDDDVVEAAEVVGDWIKQQFTKCNLCSDLGTLVGDALEALMDSDGVGEDESAVFGAAVEVLKGVGKNIVQGEICSMAASDVIQPILDKIQNIDIAGMTLNFNASAAAECFGNTCDDVWTGIESSFGQNLAGLLVSMVTSALCDCPAQGAGCASIFNLNSTQQTQIGNTYGSQPTGQSKYVVQNCKRTACRCAPMCGYNATYNVGINSNFQDWCSVEAQTTCQSNCKNLQDQDITYQMLPSESSCGCIGAGTLGTEGAARLAPGCGGNGNGPGQCPASCGTDIWMLGSNPNQYKYASDAYFLYQGLGMYEAVSQENEEDAMLF